MSATYVLAAGGTGGHFFPAEALSAVLAGRGKHVVIMTDTRTSQYAGKDSAAELVTVPAATFAGRSAFGRVLALGAIGAGVIAAFAKLRSIKPAAIIGFGGYPSLPVMLAANLARIPSALHEPNAVLGRANRLLARRAKRIAIALPLQDISQDVADRVVFTGTPMRAAVASLKASPYRPPEADGPVKLLVFGGSQGARVLSQVVPAALACLPENLRRRLRVTQQARPEDLSTVTDSYRQSGIVAEAASFFSDLPGRMADAHLVIARSGAGTVAELTVIGRPSILVPYPYATDNHQAANAAVLEKARAAWTIGESKLTEENLARMIEEIVSAPQALSACALAALSLGRADAAERLADLAEELAKELGGAV